MVALLSSQGKRSITPEKKKVVLEVGGGESPLCPDAIQVDIRPLREIDVVADAKFLPFRSKAAVEIYSSHLLEHLSYRDGILFLRECHRIMRNRARLELSCPDLSAVARIYLVTGDLQHKIGRTDRIAATFYGGQVHSVDFHLSGYDYVSLCNILADIGFDDIRRLRSAEKITDLKVKTPRQLYELRVEAFKAIRRRTYTRVRPQEQSLDWKDEAQYLNTEINLGNQELLEKQKAIEELQSEGLRKQKAIEELQSEGLRKQKAIEKLRAELDRAYTISGAVRRLFGFLKGRFTRSSPHHVR